MIITICSSANFYKQVVDIQSRLQETGFDVLIPITATRMKESGDYDVAHYKTWYDNDEDYHKKTKLMLDHFDEIAKGDAILVANYKKHSVQNYIGGNVLMEMSLALYLRKKIFILNDIPAESAFLEEIRGMQPVVLHGNLESITAHL